MNKNNLIEDFFNRELGLTLLTKCKIAITLEILFIIAGLYAYTLYPNSIFIQNVCIFSVGFFVCSFVNSFGRCIYIISFNKSFDKMFDEMTNTFFDLKVKK